MKTAQNKVADLVKQQDQGLYTPRQSVGRQVAKIAEELAEMAKFVDLPLILSKAIDIAGEVGKHQLKSPDVWDTGITNINYRFAGELADLQIAIFSLADTLDNLIEAGYDVVGRALQKVEIDIKRKVR